MRHELKLNTTYFEEALKGRKPFEIRYDDRGYKVGDEIVLKEYDGVYTGREISGEITYILDQFIGLIPGFIVFTYETESKNAWIPCKERLPEQNKPVLCWVVSKTIASGETYIIGSCDRGFWFLQTYEIGHHSFPVKDFEVVAWQPLPESYKEEV